MQIVDGYTFNIRIISPRTTGSWEADNYVIVGPSFKGTVPHSFDKDHIIQTSSRFTYVLGRTGVYGKNDIPNVHAIQKGYMLTPLQVFVEGTTTISRPPTKESVLPVFPFIDQEELAKDPPEPQVFFTYANFIMQYISIESFESDLFQQFHDISVGPGLNFEGQFMDRDQYLAIKAGVSAGSKRIKIAPVVDKIGNRANGWVGVVDPPIFGTPEVMKQRYAIRAYAAMVGLYGADPQEAYYPSAGEDIDGDSFNSTKHNYTLTFSVGGLPTVKDGGFWSITMYRLPEKLFVHNPIDRYSIGDRTEGLVYENGALTLYIQKDKPDTDTKLANWLPAPDPNYAGYNTGLFRLTMRIYWPTEEALKKPYLPPGVLKADSPKNQDTS
jgi:hypothetical protein